MSDDSGQDEQPQERHTDWWGDPISEERQAEFDALAAQQRTWAEQPEATRGESPLKRVHLTGAEVFWLAKRSLAGPDGDAAALAATETRLRSQENLERLYLDVSALHLERASLDGAHLEGANLFGAHLEVANLGGANLERASLRGADLETLYSQPLR